MNWKTRLIYAIIAFFALPGLTGDLCMSAEQNASKADSPALTPGDSWKIGYSDGTRAKRKFLREENGNLVFEVAQIAINGDISQGFLYLNRDLATVKTLDSDGKELQRFEPCSLGLQFPLFAGKKWQGRSRRFDEGKDAGTFAGTYRVVKVESVAVAAGTFRSFRVEGETYDLKAPDTRWRFVRWYAPQARAEVKVQAMTPGANPVEFEVTEFSPAQSPPPK